MTSTLARARELAAELRAAGVPAVVDVRDAPGVLPGVLVPPPRLVWEGAASYVGPVAVWTLVALAADSTGSAEAWAQLDQLVDTVADTLALDRADPSSYTLGAVSHPAYLLTYTEGL